MENKCIKKSTMNQLQVLVEFMEENPEFARGCVTFGSTKMSVEEKWTTLAKKLNSMGPPIRSVVEWKKSWADLKCRTKKKIAENKKSMSETGGGLYRMNHLTELEQIVDRTLFLSKAATPTGKVFGFTERNRIKAVDPIDECFIALKDTPPRTSKAVAVITPSRQQQHCSQEEQIITQQTDERIRSQPQQQQNRQQQFAGNDNEMPISSSAKKRKASNDDQISLIRRQLRVGEHTAAIAKEQADATKTLAEATKSLVAVIKRVADASEVQAESARKSAETQAQILRAMEALTQHLINK